jgi:hypothetical protein
MPEAESFSTRGVFNGFPSCLKKVDVSEFDYWTTFSGYNKDSGGSPSQASIDQSLQLAGKMFWNLYRVTCNIGSSNFPDDYITEIIVNGVDEHSDPQPPPPPPPIEPKDRVCGGVWSTPGNTEPNLATLDLSETGFVRMYDGDTIEANFVGYGSRILDWTDLLGDQAQINTGFIDLLNDPQSMLGGYGNDPEPFGYTSEFAYIQRGGIHFLWYGVVFGDVNVFVDSDTLRAWAELNGNIEAEAQILDFEFWT